MTADVHEIRQNTVLPARREEHVVRTADGFALEAAVARPTDGDAAGTIVCLHPLPTQGGSMDSHLLRKMDWRLPALAGLAVVRINTRGTGRSEGAFDGGEGEAHDVRAALDLAAELQLPKPWLLGWSFGTELVLMYGAASDDVVGGILLAPPLKRATDDDLDRWGTSGKPLVAVVPELDDYLQPPEARVRFARVPQAEVIAVDRAKHLFVGYTETVLDIVVSRVRPGHAPLPSTYEGTL
jgi:alpha/beta superfamily hydrolase